MKIAVYGATGRVGTQVVTEALGRGHQVTALSRRAVEEAPDGARPLQGDATDAASVAAVAGSHDVVVSALGPSRAPGGDPGAFAAAIATLARAVGSTRLVVVGGAGSLLAEPGVRLVDSPDFPAAYRAEALAQSDALQALRETADSAEWTYLSPAPELVDGPRTGEYRTGADNPVGAQVTVSDYAVALLDEIEQPQHRRQRFTVAN